jgi:hypothetical protein
MSDAPDTYVTITDEDHGGYLWIAVILCFVFATSITVARLSVKWKFFGPDDWTIIASQVYLFRPLIVPELRLNSFSYGPPLPQSLLVL